MLISQSAPQTEMKIPGDYSPIGLKDLNTINSLNRHDTKFIFNENSLNTIFEEIKSDYALLEIKGLHEFGYLNRYFDTNDFTFYFMHHAGNRPRFKIRVRQYLDNNSCVFEIKEKTNKERTKKHRIAISEELNISDWMGFQSESGKSKMIQSLIVCTTGLNPLELASVTDISFTRMTLANLSTKERITIDTQLTFTNGTISKRLENIAIAEIKQIRYNPKSPFIQTMRHNSIREIKFSKYCHAMAELYSVKRNRFKPRFLMINKLAYQSN